MRLDPNTLASVRVIHVGRDPVGVAADAGMDTRTNRVVATIRVGHRPQGILVTRTAVWVTVRW